MNATADEVLLKINKTDEKTDQKPHIFELLKFKAILKMQWPFYLYKWLGILKKLPTAFVFVYVCVYVCVRGCMFEWMDWPVCLSPYSATV